MASSPIGAGTEQKSSSSELEGCEQSMTVEQRLDRLEKAALWIKEFLISTARAPVHDIDRENTSSGFVTPYVGIVVTPDDEEKTLPLEIVVEQPVKQTTSDTVDRVVSVLPLPNPRVPVALGKGEAHERLVTKETVIQPLGNIIEQLVCDVYLNEHVDVDSVTSEVTVVCNVSKRTEILTDGRRFRLTDRNYKFRKRKIWREDRFSSTKSKRYVNSLKLDLGVRTIGRKQGYDWLRRGEKNDAALATCLVNYGMHFRSLSSEKNRIRFQFMRYGLGRGTLPQEKRAQIMGTPLKLDKYNGKCGFGFGLQNPLNPDRHDCAMMVEVQRDSKAMNRLINSPRDSEHDDLYPEQDGCRKPLRHGLSELWPSPTSEHSFGKKAVIEFSCTLKVGTEEVYSTSLSRTDLVWEPSDPERYSYHGELGIWINCFEGNNLSSSWEEFTRVLVPVKKVLEEPRRACLKPWSDPINNAFEMYMRATQVDQNQNGYMLLQSVAYVDYFSVGVYAEEKQFSRLSQANHVWKPGGLSFKQVQLVWLGRIHNGDRVLKLVNAKCHEVWSFDIKAHSGLEIYCWKHKRQMVLGSMDVIAGWTPKEIQVIQMEHRMGKFEVLAMYHSPRPPDCYGSMDFKNATKGARQEGTFLASTNSSFFPTWIVEGKVKSVFFET